MVLRWFNEPFDTLDVNRARDTMVAFGGQAERVGESATGEYG